MKAKLMLCLSLLVLQTAEAREFRDFTNQAGKKIHGELLDLEEGKVRIRSKGKVFFIPVEKLSQKDQTWLNEWDLKRKGELDKLYYKDVLFEDDFSGEGFGEKWKHYKSESLLQEGVMVGKTVDIEVHPGCDSVRVEGRRDMEVRVKFKFASDEAKNLNVWFDDYSYKGSQAGHIVSVSVRPKGISIRDAKTGSDKWEIYNQRKTPEGLDDATKELLKTKSKVLPIDIEESKGEWHELLIRTKADKLLVKIDGEDVGEFQSEGVAHMTKSQVSLTTTVNDVHYDDFSIHAASNEGLEEVTTETKKEEEE